MKFIHIADVHLGIKPDRGRIWSDKRALEIEDSFRDIINICEDENVELLLIAGDLFHAPPTMNELKNLDFTLRRLTNTKTIIVAGNRDYIEEDSAWETYEFISDTVVFPRDRAVNAYFEDLNVCITGYSYGKSEYTGRILEQLKPGREGAYNILLGHGGDKLHMPFSKERLAKAGFNYIALGHIHRPSHILKNKMAFPGSLEPLDYTETGRRGYILGEVSIDGTTNITWVPHNKRSYVNMSVSLTPEHNNADIMQLVQEQIQKNGEDNIFRIMLKGYIDSDLQINLSSLNRSYNINEIIDKTKYYYDVNEIYVNNHDNMAGKFLEAMRSEDGVDDSDIRELALKYGINALLGAGDM